MFPQHKHVNELDLAMSFGFFFMTGVPGEQGSAAQVGGSVGSARGWSLGPLCAAPGCPALGSGSPHGPEFRDSSLA